MSDLDRRSLEEFITLYELEPTVRDLFVEGPIDRAFYQWFLDALDVEIGSIHAIDTVDIPRLTCEKHGLAVGNRSEVIAAALEMTDRWEGGDLQQATYIVDADLDVLDWPYGSCVPLLRTDYPAVESYAFEQKVLNRIMAVFLPGKVLDVKSIESKFANILKMGFALRRVNARARWQCRWLGLSSCCTLRSDVPHMDVEDYIRRTLSTEGRLREFGDFQVEVRECFDGLKGEPRLFVYGRDFADVVAWYIRTVDRGTRCSTALAKKAILLALDIQDLLAEGLFRGLVARLVA